MAEEIQNAPVVGWFEDSLALEDEVVETINYGTVEAGTDSVEKKFFIINNRNGETDVPKMEGVTFTTRDRQGGLGNVPGQEVEAVKDNWFMIRVDSLSEDSFTAVGGGGGANGTQKELGTNGSTTSRHYSEATEWTANTEFELGQFVKSTDGADTFVYLVTLPGTSGGTEPSWNQSEGENTTDGTVTYKSYRVVQTPATGELLGIANKIEDDGTGATDAGGNFAEITVYAEVPDDAKSGLNKLLFRVNYKYV